MKRFGRIINLLSIGIELLISYCIAPFFHLLYLVRQQRHTEPQNILIFSSGGLGDAIMMLPMLRAVRQAFPNASITGLTMLPSVASEILTMSGCVDTILRFDYKNATFRVRWNMNRQLIHKNFDVALCPYTSPVPHFLRALFHIPLRVGHTKPTRGLKHPPLGHVFTNPVALTYNDRQHETERYCALAEELHIDTQPFRRDIHLHVQTSPLHRAEEYIRTHGVQSNDIVVGIHPAVGATQPWRQWGVENLIATAQHVRTTYHARILLFGSDADTALLEEMNTRLGMVGIIITPERVCKADVLPLEMTAAFLRQCALLIANDGGIAHLANACRIPTVRMFGMTDYYGYRALENIHTDVWKALPCSPCMGLGVIKPGYNLTNCGHHNCIRHIAVEDVVEAVERHLNKDIKQEEV